MHTLRPVFASALLVALAMGGVVLPVLHDAAHGAERVEVELAHNDHHHHQLQDDHGAEAQPFCPEAAEIDLVCALCSSPPVAVLASAPLGLIAPGSSQGLAAAARGIDADETPRSARGPPTA